MQDLLVTRFTLPIPGEPVQYELRVQRSGPGGAPPRPPVVTEMPQGHLVTGDFDGDGRQDLVTGSILPDETGAYAVAGLLGQGDGTFIQAAPLTMAESPAEILTGELNGDGRPDLVVLADDFGGSVRVLKVLLGAGDGTFVPGPAPPGSGSPNTASLADLNDDHRLDLILGYSGTPADSDGEVGVRLGNGDGTFGSEQRFGTGPSCSEIQAADLNEDGALDLVITLYDPSGPGQISILDGRGDGTFEGDRRLLASWFLGEVFTGDLNGDGHVDLLVSNAFAPSRMSSVALFNDGHGQFTPGEPFVPAFDSLFFGAVFADLDADGDLDLAGGTDYQDLVIGQPLSVNVLAIHMNDGQGGFQTSPRTFAGPQVGPLVTDDFDGDGRPDLATDGITVYLNNGPFPSVAPTAVAQAPAQAECTSAGGTSVLLDGTGSSDDQAIVSYEWFLDYGFPGETLLGTGASLPVSLPLGDHAVTLRVTDAGGLIGTDTIPVRVTDTVAPSLTVTATPGTLWPPNGDYHDVHVTAGASDACGPVSVVLVSITSSEPDADAVLDAEPGTAGFDVRLQADKKTPTRTYTLLYGATDGAGHTTESATTVEVRKSKLRR